MKLTLTSTLRLVYCGLVASFFIFLQSVSYLGWNKKHLAGSAIPV